MAFHLRVFDFRIPISTLHQPHHDAAVIFLSHGVEPVEHMRCGFAIGLHHHAEAIPTVEDRVCKNCFDHINRDFQTACFFRVDVKANTC